MKRNLGWLVLLTGLVLGGCGGAGSDSGTSTGGGTGGGGTGGGGTGGGSNWTLPDIKQLVVTGSAEPEQGRVPIHYNVNEGRFTLGWEVEHDRNYVAYVYLSPTAQPGEGAINLYSGACVIDSSFPSHCDKQGLLNCQFTNENKMGCWEPGAPYTYMKDITSFVQGEGVN